MDILRGRTPFNLFLLVIGCVIVNLYGVKGVTLTPTFTGGILTEELIVSCPYTLNTGETFNSLTMSRFINNEEKDLLKFQLDEAQTSFFGGNEDIQSRSNFTQNATSCSLNVTATKCADEVRFTCSLEYRGSGVLNTVEQTIDVKVTARPEAPSSLIKQPSDDEVAQYTEVKYECTSVVGKGTPIGSVKWEGVRGGVVVEDLTSNSKIEREATTVNSCTTYVISSLTRNVTRNDNGLKIRCRTTHPTLSTPDMFKDTKTLIVYYPVEDENLSVIQDPNSSSHIVGSKVTLKCSINSIPLASYVWRHLESNTTNHTEGSLVLRNVQLTNSGTYSCEASNSYLGTNYTARGSINVNIQVKPTTTPAPPTKSSERTTFRPGVTDGSVLDAAPDQTTIIIVVVVAVIVALIIVAIVIFVIFRNRKKKEDDNIVDSTGNAYNYNNNPKLTGPNKPDVTNVDDKKPYMFENPYQSDPYSYTYPNHNNSFDMKSDRSYSDLTFENRPGSRRPLAMSDADYADIAMPHV